jgi:rhodanese-related sulfurtransferase
MATSARELVDAALDVVQTLTVEQARAELQAGGVRFVDVRESAEREREGGLPGAHLVPRGVLEFWADATSPWHRAELFPDAAQRTVVFCAIGWRSALAAQTLMQLGYRNVAHIGGGFEAWRAAGAPVQPPRAQGQP